MFQLHSKSRWVTGAATTATCNERKYGMGNDMITGSMADRKDESLFLRIIVVS